MTTRGDALDLLYAEIRAAPDDDRPRLVWADAEGSERGELVSVQCLLARPETPRAQRLALRRREAELLAAHGRDWAGLDEIASACVFRRGFVEAVQLLAAPEDHADRQLRRLLFESPLVRSLVLAINRPRELAWLREVLAHSFIGAFDYIAVVDNLYEAGAAMVVAEGLDAVAPRGLELPATVSLAALHHGTLAACEELRLTDEPIDVATLRGLAGWAPKLRALHCFAQGGPEAHKRTRATHTDLAFARAVPATITELDSNFDGEQLTTLAGTPAGAGLERLRVTGHIGERVGAFALFPRLRSLDLAGCRPGYADDRESQRVALDSLVRMKLPALRELVLPDGAGAPELRALAETYGDQLDFVDNADPALAAQLGLPVAVDPARRPWSMLPMIAAAPGAPWFLSGYVALE